MGMCPLCNGFSKLHADCRKCGNSLEDHGREAEYYDDYSPYMPIDGMKLENGYPEDGKNQECTHLFICPHCGYDQIIFVKE